MRLEPPTAPLLRRLLFPSTPTRRPPLPDEVPLAIGATTLYGRLAHPEAARATVYFGGNGEDATGYARRFAQALPDEALYLVNYRGYGASAGVTTARTMVADGVALVDLVAQRHPSAPVAVIGRSMGSGVAMQVAARRTLRRLALVTPFDSLTAVAADLVRLPPWVVAPVMPDRLESLAAAARLGATPVLVLSAGRDTLVRPARTARLVSELHRHGVPTTTEVFCAADHQSIALEPGYWQALTRFFD